jgi:Ca2+-binding RTX toxin-like protein
LDVQEPVLEVIQTAPPQSPVLGARYLLLTDGLSDAWAGHAGEIAVWNGTAWEFTLPIEGWVVTTEGDAAWLYIAGQWRPFDILGNVLDKDLTTPPSSPSTGDAYLLAADSLLDAWSGHAGEIAVWNGTAWGFTAPTEGLAVSVTDEGRVYVYVGGQWITPAFFCHGLVVTLVGTSGDDLLVGTEGPDVIHGLGGNDTIKGLSGRDVICGGAGNDKLWGGKGRDKLYGGKGKDKLYGSTGRDRLYGGRGRDRCYGGGGYDRASRCELKVSVP